MYRDYSNSGFMGNHALLFGLISDMIGQSFEVLRTKWSLL